MINMLEFSLTLMFLTTLFTFCSIHKHLLMTLLSLEMLVLVMYLLFFIFMVTYNCGGYFILLFLTFSVCEGCLGLAILVSLIRCHGNDMIMSMNMLSW
uniref:NADH-ubiquinone oxidoreductase chain 4L n=1 Tax=Nabis ferus TaxID=347965 RepID=A0A7D5FUK2_9HEMI|nr:NADH dehydrogenase subunit 4L [Nabis ferus]QLF99795.1 NADH dehydrogenase subunit 4L [Nabis ferus]